MMGHGFRSLEKGILLDSDLSLWTIVFRCSGCRRCEYVAFTIAIL